MRFAIMGFACAFYALSCLFNLVKTKHYPVGENPTWIWSRRLSQKSGFKHKKIWIQTVWASEWLFFSSLRAPSVSSSLLSVNKHTKCTKKKRSTKRKLTAVISRNLQETTENDSTQIPEGAVSESAADVSTESRCWETSCEGPSQTKSVILGWCRATKESWKPWTMKPIAHSSSHQPAPTSVRGWILLSSNWYSQSDALTGPYRKLLMSQGWQDICQEPRVQRKLIHGGIRVVFQPCA